MSHPVLFAIDDDPGVVRALRDDLGRRFGEDFRVIGTSSPAAGRAMLGELADEHVTVAVLIVGHQMREMPGAEFLARAHRMHPRAKRVLPVERDYSPGRRGWGRLAARPGTAAARDLRTRRFRSGRRALPVAQAGPFRRRRPGTAVRLVPEYLATKTRAHAD